MDREQMILKHLAGELTVEEARELVAWRHALADHDDLYAAYQKLWQATAPAALPIPVDLEAEWERLRQRLHLGETPPKARILPLRRWQPSYAVAASIVLLLVGAAFWFFMLRTGPYQAAYAANAEVKTVTLADGSTVRLNSGSTLSYPSSFSDQERRVELDGEAFFEVEAGEIPFVVASANAQVRVLGTAFNVWARGPETRVAVRQGRVAFEALDAPGSSLEVTANQAAVRRGNQPPVRLDASSYAAALDWLDGRLVFERTPLTEVIAELTRRYDQPIQLQASDLADKTITGSFSDKTLEGVLASVCLSLDCQFVVEKGVYVISDGG